MRWINPRVWFPGSRPCSIPFKRRASAARHAILCLWLAGASLPALAQAPTGDPFREARFGSGSLRLTNSRVLPEIRLRLARTIELPGPLSSDLVTILRADGVAIPTAEGWHLARWDTDLAMPIATPRQLPEPGLTWVSDRAGERRFYVAEDGALQAECCCKPFRRRWHPFWKAHLPGNAVSTPLIFESALVIAATDNKVYGLRPRNGHRLWNFDVGQRASRRLVAWDGMLPIQGKGGVQETAEIPLVLIVPDAGDRIVALDPSNGLRVAQHVMTGEGERLFSTPIVNDQGEIVIAVQRYDPSRAALLVFVLEVIDPKRTKDQIPSAKSSPSSSPTPETRNNG